MSARSERVDLYKIAVEEYRFQVQLNWDRAKYLLAFNTAVIGAGTGLFKVGGNSAHGLIAGIFIVGLIAAISSLGAVDMQHQYYRSARNAMTAQARQLRLAESGIATTPGARGRRTTLLSQLGRVQNILYILLTIIAGIDAYGIFYALSR